MPPHTWKAVERKICRYLLMDRTPLSGGNGRITRADCRECGTNTNLFVEVKHGSSVPRTWKSSMKLFEDTEMKAAVEKKRAVVVLHPKRMAGVAMYPAFIRLNDGELNGHIVQIPLEIIKIVLLKQRYGEEE